MSDNKTLRLGDTVYFEICAPTTEPEIMRGRLCTMKINDFANIKPNAQNTDGIICVIDNIIFARTDHPFTGIHTCKITDLYTSPLALCNARIAAEEAIRDKYRNEINDTKSLVKFMFKHDISGNDNKNHARYVAKEKAHELLGIAIKDTDDEVWFSHPDNPNQPRKD